MKDYRTYSYWLESCGDDLIPRAPLDGSIAVDVGILGAGFTGLWTAYHLLQRDSTLKIAVIEAEIAGFGASGRNGGWCFSGFPVSSGELRRTYGLESTRAVEQAMYDSVDDVGRVCEAEGIDAHYRKSGSLEIARSPYQFERSQEHYDEFKSIGLEDHYELLNQEQMSEHMNVARSIGGFWNKEGATVQPARLARGLAHAVERHGGTIYEQTRVTDFVSGPAPKLVTERGDVHAKVIVLAGEAYLSRLPKLRRQIMPFTSHIVLTEPLSDDEWGQIGWERREVVGGSGTSGGYLNHTADGRIAFGAYRARYPFNAHITDALDRQEDIFEHARQATIDWFPMLKNVHFTHSWGGVFGIPRDRMPTMSYDRKNGVATGRGYTGEGVATSNLSGRVLADLITERDSALTHLPMTTHQSPNWEPEPLRWMGVSAVRYSRLKMNRTVERTGKAPTRKTLAQRFFDY